MSTHGVPIRHGMFIMPLHDPAKPLDLMDEQIIAGDVDEVLRRLLRMMEETGRFGTLVLMAYDWDDKSSWVRSMELFARELMPALNKAVA
jgi:hypothetical protein